MKKLLLLLCLLPLSARAEVESLSTHGNWHLYSYAENDKKICFISAAPGKQSGKFTKRDPVAFFITKWPEENAKNVASVTMGYTVKDKSAPAVTIGSGKYELFAKDDKAWTKDGAADDMLLKALRAGDSMTVKGTSARGNEITDTYSLKGISAALKALESCGG